MISMKSPFLPKTLLVHMVTRHGLYLFVRYCLFVVCYAVQRCMSNILPQESKEGMMIGENRENRVKKSSRQM